RGNDCLTIYMKIILLFLSLVITTATNAQIDNSKILKLKSVLCKIQVKRTPNSEWETQDFSIDHLIVIDYVHRKIDIYREDSLEEDLDMLKMADIKEMPSFIDITYNCLDSKNLRCQAIFTLDKDNRQPFMIRLDYAVVVELLLLL